MGQDCIKVPENSSYLGFEDSKNKLDNLGLDC
jgi:hypothetical protein